MPLGWAIDGANRNDVKLLAPTIDSIRDAGFLADVDTMHLDRGYDYPRSGANSTLLGSRIWSFNDVVDPATQTGRCRCG